MNESQQYFEYLKKKTFLGSAYRNLFLYPKLIQHLKGKLLDVGCGVGDMLVFRPNSVGVDINSFNVNFCKWRGCNVYEMSVDQLQFEDASFDSVLLDNVLEHIENPIPLLLEIKRVMRSDAFLLIGVPGFKGQLSDLDHKAFYDESRLTELATQMGFNVNVIMYTPLWKSIFLSKIMKQYCIYTQWSLKK